MNMSRAYFNVGGRRANVQRSINIYIDPDNTTCICEDDGSWWWFKVHHQRGYQVWVDPSDRRRIKDRGWVDISKFKHHPWNPTL